jgi:Eukaryotic DNA topoisomerase I, catalytic core
VQPSADFVRLYRESGGGDRPVQGGLKVCWGPDEAAARKTMHRLWPTDAVPGEPAQLLPLPRHFGQLAQLVSEDMISAPCGPDPEVHAEGLRAYLRAGGDEVYVGQVGPEVEGFFEFYRAGGEEYAAEHGTFGLATIRREHVTCRRGELVFEYPAKGAIQREQAVADEQVQAVIRSLKRRRWGGSELLAYRGLAGPHDVTAADINGYLGEISGGDFTVKDFRTWHATVLAAVGLAVSLRAESDSARKRAVARVLREVAHYLGNTPAVARASYIDPRVIDRYQDGATIARILGELGASSEFGELAAAGRAEAAVLRLLRAAS